MGLLINLLCIFALLFFVQKSNGNGNNSVIADLRQPTPTKVTRVSNPVASLILDTKESTNNDSSATIMKANSRVKRQYYNDGYYRRYPYYEYPYPLPLPIFIGGGGFFGGRGFGGRGFGGRGFGGRGVGGRGVGGFGGHGVGGGGGGHGGGGGRG